MMTDFSAKESNSTAGGTMRHIPVLLGEVLAALTPRAGEIYIDGTFGAGGYSSAILKAAECKVLAIDRDLDVVQNAASLLAQYQHSFTLKSACFGNMDAIADQVFGDKVDGVVLDIGISSMQIDQAERGFSFQAEGPLDMRMTQTGLSARDVINTYSEEDLADIFYYLGEERKSRQIAKAIIIKRMDSPIETTKQLAVIVEEKIKSRQKTQ